MSSTRRVVDAVVFCPDSTSGWGSSYPQPARSVVLPRKCALSVLFWLRISQKGHPAPDLTHGLRLKLLLWLHHGSISSSVQSSFLCSLTCTVPKSMTQYTSLQKAGSESASTEASSLRPPTWSRPTASRLNYHNNLQWPPQDFPCNSNVLYTAWGRGGGKARNLPPPCHYYMYYLRWITEHQVENTWMFMENYMHSLQHTLLS